MGIAAKMNQLTTKLTLEIARPVSFVWPSGSTKIVELDVILGAPLDFFPGQQIKRKNATRTQAATIPGKKTPAIDQANSAGYVFVPKCRYANLNHLGRKIPQYGMK